VDSAALRPELDAKVFDREQWLPGH
jgi:hypothetical protein